MRVQRAPSGAIRITELEGWAGWRFEIMPDAEHEGALGFGAHAPSGKTITPEQWRDVPFEALLAAAKFAMKADYRVMATLTSLTETRPAKRPYGGEDRDPEGWAAFLSTVAEVYRAALEHGAPPDEVVAQFWSLKNKVVGARYITQARDAGVIGHFHEEKLKHGGRKAYWKFGETGDLRYDPKPEAFANEINRLREAAADDQAPKG